MFKAARKKEEERIEKIIRNLLKLPENRRCINCTSLGPQYVCTTFLTFVCTNCSGLHREFTHRVKSVSMAKFTAEEVGALEAGGNERAREIYFKVWDPQRHIFPDGSNQSRLRDFIKQVYVDRKYTGESTAVTKTEASEDLPGRESVNSSSYRRRTVDGGSNYLDDERRGPRYKEDTVKSRNRPARFEIVDNRFRDDDCGRGRRRDAPRANNARSISPVAQKTQEKTSPPASRSVKDILGEDIPPLRVGRFPEDKNAAKNKNIDTQENSASSSATTPVDEKPPKLPEYKREKSVSLIDFMADSEPSDPAAAPQTQETAVGVNEELVKSPKMVNASNTPQVNSLELMLFDLADPVSSEVSGNVDIPNAAPGESMVKDYDESQLTTSGAISFASQPYDQAWSSSPASITQSSSSASVIEPIQPGLNVAQDITSQTGPQASSVEANSTGRGELPMDLFSGGYPSFQAPVHNWQYPPPHGMGYNMYQHYPPNSMPAPSFPNVARSRNPFDLNDDATQEPTAMYPSMFPVQDAASSVPAHHALLSVSQPNSYQFVQSHGSSYQAMPPTHIPTYGMPPVPGAFSGQQLPYGTPLSGLQENKCVSTEQQNDPFASLGQLLQRPSGGHPVPSQANSFPSAEGNPFG